MIVEGGSLAGQDLTKRALNEKIDKLFACGVGKYVNLPQLVVVGNQSSGKSSVLEGLTKLNFPRDSGLCTRFATQIIFRREPSLRDREISACIIPTSNLDAKQDQKVRTWKASGLQSLSPQEFSRMMHEVHEIMGLSSEDDDGKPTFSDNVLELEIKGPDESHLSIIDVPGIFKNTTSGRTTKNDIAMVRSMVLGYMQNPRSIMLAVVPANVDIATQEIVEMARDEDPQELRTLRILTKPDLVDEGAEGKIVQLINDGNAKGQLGWILVRNLSQKQMSNGNVDRDTEEALFHHTSPWNQVVPENYGIGALKARLQELLTTTVRREFPSVRTEVIKRLRESKESLESLGAQRDTPEQQRRIILEIVSAFQDITRHATATNYGAHKIFDEINCSRLATHISSRNSVFSDDLESSGHLFEFASMVEDQSLNSVNPKASSQQDQIMIESRKSTGVHDLQEILVETEEIEASFKSAILPWIKDIYQASRGFEIGTFNHTLLSTLMRKQTVKWPVLAWGYVSDIINYVHAFISEVLDDICNNHQLFTGIMSALRDDLFSAYRRGMSMNKFLLEVERGGTPMTLNHYLNDNLERSRQERFNAAIADKVFDNFSQGEVVRLSDLTAQHNMSNLDHTVQDIHDILESYYKVARKRFVDNVCMQAVYYHLVTGPEAPMKLISPTWVNDLSNDALEEIAGEDVGSKRRRKQLQKEIEDSETGRRILWT